MIKKVLPVTMLLTIGAQPAFAYIDPGSGSAIMTVVIGVLVSFGVLMKTFWYKIKRFLGLSKSKSAKTECTDDCVNDDKQG